MPRRNSDRSEYDDEITKRWYLEDVKKPIYVMYGAMSQTVNASTLASLELDDIELPKREKVKQFFACLLDPSKLKSILSQNFSVDQVNMLQQLCIEYGRRTSGRGSYGLYVVIAVLVGGLGFLAGVTIGPKLGL